MIAYRLQLLSFFAIDFFGACMAVNAQHAHQKITPGLFIENKGQWETNVLYRSELPGGHLYIEKDRFLFNFWDAEAASQNHHGHTHTKPAAGQTLSGGDPQQTIPPGFIDGHAYEVRFLGCNPVNSTKAEHASSYTHNYFKGTDKSKWASNISGYKATILENIYPGTSLKCFGQETGFKYEFHLQPGADASVIKLQYSGADSLYLKNGELHLHTSVNSLIEQRPFSYQVIEGRNIEVECAFHLKDSTLTFSFPKGYNKKYPLIIDPQLVFSTFSGSLADNWGNTATYDEDGNSYMVGIAFGAGYPVTLGAYQIVYRGTSETVTYADFWQTTKNDPDLAIMKFNPTGQLLYATYLGGTETEVPSSVIVNSQKQLVMLGFTGSDGQSFTSAPGVVFPTTAGAYDQTFNGGVGTTQSGGPLGRFEGIFFDRGSDLFVTILSENGNSLIASTLIGGSNNDGLTFRMLPPQSHPLVKNYGDQFRSEILCDENDDIYIVTKTNSNDIINTSVPGYDKTHNGFTDAYVCKMSADLSTMIWNTYIGGSDHDAGYSIRIAEDKSVYICGGTASTNFPKVTPLKSTLNFSDTDGFISHLSEDGSSLLHSTYIGTSSYDQTFFIQLDKDQNVYVFGQTLGNYPMTAGVFGTPSTGQFIQKLDPALSTSLMSTTFGNQRNKVSIVPTAFLVNDCGNIMLSGWGGFVNSSIENDPSTPSGTISTGYIGGSTLDLPLTPDAFQKTTDGSDFYVMVLRKNATELLYATYFGGNGEIEHVDGGTSRFDKRGIIYQAVCGGCGGTSEFPTTPGAHSNSNNSTNCNNAIFKFDLTNIKAAFISDTASCVPFDVTFTNKSIGGRAFHWDLGDLTTSDEFGPIKHTYTKPGSYTVQLIVTDLTTCIGKDTAEKIITVYPLPDSGLNLKDTTLCKGDTIQLLTSCNPDFVYKWSPLTNVIDPTLCTAKFHPTSETDYYLTVTDTNSCVKVDTVTIHVAELLKGIGWENVTECQGKPTIRLYNPSTGPIHYLWTFGDGSSSTDGSPTHEYPSGGTYPIVVDIYNDHCSLQDVTSVSLTDVKIPNLVTPNGDQLNDCYEIKGLYNNWQVDIYNAWNKRIFKSEQYANDFCADGLSEGVYYYLVCPPYGDCCKGWLHIVDKNK